MVRYLQLAFSASMWIEIKETFWSNNSHMFSGTELTNCNIGQLKSTQIIDETRKEIF